MAGLALFVNGNHLSGDELDKDVAEVGQLFHVHDKEVVVDKTHLGDLTSETALTITSLHAIFFIPVYQHVTDFR